MAAASTCSRALLAGALLFAPAAANAGCEAGSIDDRARVEAVYDGDTVRLADGRTVRLIGLNTPELNHDTGPDQPLAPAAREALRALLARADERVGLAWGTERRDRHDRVLAHVFLPNGRNLTRRLLQRGLGWQVAIPPNLAHVDCYARAEDRARRAERGVWDHPALDPVAADALPAGGGFRLVRGRIERVGESDRAFWLELGGLTLRLARADLRYFEDAAPQRWHGRALIVRGWIYRVDGAARMNLYHPAAVEWLDPES